MHIEPKNKESDAESFDVQMIRRDFPLLHLEVEGNPLVYLDNASTTQKPQQVIDAITRYYTQYNSNVHRNIHHLSEIATDMYEGARSKIQRFIGADLNCEIVFTRGTTDGINLIANSFGNKFIGEGDEVLISQMEHHSNIVPWQMLRERTGAVIKVAPINDDGEIEMEEFEKLLSDRTKLVSIIHVSNALGTVNPIEEIVRLSHDAGAKVLVDGAQSVAHVPIDVSELDCDFFVFSAHKLYGPTGIGVLYGKADLLEEMPPYQGGGDMILSVTFDKTIYNSVPHKFEAGTPNIAGVIGMGAAIDYLEAIGLENIHTYEQELLEYGTDMVKSIDGLRLIGTARDKVAILSFVLGGVHPHDIGQILDDNGIAIRIGHHCAQPVMDRFNVPATARASLAFYNTKGELDALADGINEVKEVFG